MGVYNGSKSKRLSEVSKVRNQLATYYTFIRTVKNKPFEMQQLYK